MHVAESESVHRLALDAKVIPQLVAALEADKSSREAGCLAWLLSQGC
jgi:hypothetical protein